MKYILTLQETVALSVVDEYARATKRPTLVQIHSTPGLGYAIGALRQAKRGHASLPELGNIFAPEANVIHIELKAYSPAIERYRPPTKPEDSCRTRGGSLGVGMPGGDWGQTRQSRQASDRVCR